MNRRSQTKNLLLIIAFLLIILGVSITIRRPPADGYEVSIYQVYPVYFWVALVGAHLIGIMVILWEGFDLNGSRERWRIGFLAILSTEALLLFLPAIRGYQIYGRADAVTHIGFMRSIHESGSFGTRNIYPGLHDYSLSLSYVTGLSFDAMVNLVPPLISLFFLVSFLALICEAFDDQRRLFAVPFASILVITGGHLNFAPFVMSTMLFPLVLFLFLKYRDRSSSRVFFALVVVTVSIVFYHPLTMVFIILTFALSYTVERVTSTKPTSFNVMSMAAIVFGIWYFSFSGMLKLMSTTIYNLTYNAGVSDAEQYGSVIARTSPQFIDLLQVATLRFGIFLILSSFTGLCVLYLVFRYLAGQIQLTYTNTVFVASYTGFSAISILFFFNDVIGGFGRPLDYAKLFGVLTSGLFFGLATTSTNRTKLKFSSQAALKIALTIGLVAMVVISTLALYPSPLEKEQNRQTTLMDINGMDWVFHYRNEDVDFLEIGITPRRYHDRAFGTLSPGANVPGPNRPPDHFGYNNFSHFGQLYMKDTIRYLLITEHGRSTYPEVFPDYESLWRFTPTDFQSLNRDPTVANLYANGEFDVYHVRGINRTARV